MTPTDLPADMAMLLRLIDAKFETFSAKLDGLSAMLTVITEEQRATGRRLDGHETRLQTIEGVLEARKLQVVEFEQAKTDIGDHETRLSQIEVKGSAGADHLKLAWGAIVAFAAVLGWAVNLWMGHS